MNLLACVVSQRHGSPSALVRDVESGRGCTKVSPGCKFCYAELFAERFRGVSGHSFEKGFDLRLVPEKSISRCTGGALVRSCPGECQARRRGTERIPISRSEASSDANRADAVSPAAGRRAATSNTPTSTAAVQASLEQRQRFQRLFFPDGIAFNGNGFVRTAVTAPVFSYLRPIEGGNEGLVDQNSASWN